MNNINDRYKLIEILEKAIYNELDEVDERDIEELIRELHWNKDLFNPELSKKTKELERKMEYVYDFFDRIQKKGIL